MTTRIAKIRVTPITIDPMTATYDFFLYDPVTQETSYEQFVGEAVEDWDTPLKVGDLLKAEYPDIDLPTTA